MLIELELEYFYDAEELLKRFSEDKFRARRSRSPSVNYVIENINILAHSNNSR